MAEKTRISKPRKEKIDYEIVEILGTATPIEDIRTTYAKSVIRSLWRDHGELKDGIDIRWLDTADEKQKKALGGIRLTIAEAHNVCDILLEHGYGSTQAIKDALTKRISLIEDEKPSEEEKDE